MKQLITLLFCLACASFMQSQIRVLNPGFEDKPADATMPTGWQACEDGTTPDILPGFWGEHGKPSQGKSFIGLITREDATFESIGQPLSSATVKGECYRFTIDLARGAVYAGFDKAIRLRIWLGTRPCEKDQLVFTSEFIHHTGWKSYPIKFVAGKAHRYIRMEAYYEDGSFSHKGNILIDNLSSIVVCNRA